MYLCNECKAVFDTPKKESLESFYGVSDEFNYSCGNVELCPYCDSCDYEEITEEELNDGEEVDY